VVLDLLTGAAAAHGVHEKQDLGGVYDEEWPTWYAAHMVGALDSSGFELVRKTAGQTKVTLVIDHPADADEFEASVPQLISKAASFPGLVRLESARVLPKEDNSPTPAHRTLDLYFERYDLASKAVASAQAVSFFEQLASSGVTFTGLFSQVEGS
jgi:hypothetical protein